MFTSSNMLFKNFPRIQYRGKYAVDLLTNIKVTREKFQTKLKLEPFVVSDEDTMEGLAHWIYKDPYMFYVLALLNDVQDPFNDWVCSPLELNRIVIDKYRETFLTRHKERVIAQIHDFFFNIQKFYFSKKLTSGRYYIKLYFKDPSAFGKIKISITDNEKIRDELKEKTEIYSNLLVQYGESESQSFLDLTSDSSFTTKLFVEAAHNNVKVDLAMTDFHPFTFEELTPYKESCVAPYTSEFFIEKGSELVLEYNNVYSLAEILFYGGGGDLFVEVYNASYLLIHRTSTYQFLNFKEFVDEFAAFLTSPIYEYENPDLYVYSNKLMHEIVKEIYENQKITNFLNFSIKTIKEFLISKYNEKFSPIMYDIMSDYYNEKQNSEMVTSDTLAESLTKVKCASVRGLDLKKRDVRSIDGVILQPNDVILLKDQNNKVENGLYKYSDTFSLMRMKSFNYYPLMTILVEQGTKNTATEWMLTNRDNVVEGSELHFIQVYGVIFEQNSILKNLKKLQGIVELEEYNFYAQDIYNDTHHWETTDESIFGSGVEVDSEYTEPVIGDRSRTRITNFEYETQLNDTKRNIIVLRPDSIEMFTSAFNELLGIK